MKFTAVLVFLIGSALIFPIGITNAQQAQAKKYIAFRDDCPKPFMPLDTLKAINQVHIEEGVPVTLAIIPHPRKGQEGNQLLQDDQFITYMRSIAPNPLFEFAQHGYTHTPNNLSVAPSEFSGLPYLDQYNRIWAGRADMKEAFGMVPKTFIPPFDNGDNNTLLAAEALGFTEYSTFSASYAPHSYANGMRIDGGIEFGAVNETAFSKSIQQAQNTTDQFLNDPTSDDMLIVTYHYWAFQDSNGAVDNQRIQQLTDFITHLKTKGALFTRLDRADISGGVVSAPNAELGVLEGGLIFAPSAELAPILKELNSAAFLLVLSLSIVLSSIYVRARRQHKTMEDPKHPKH